MQIASGIRGRPSKYDSSMCDIIISKGMEGGTVTEMAVAIGVHKDTLYDWIKNDTHPEFSDAMKKAIEFSQAWWEEIGRKGTTGKIPNFNATGFIFNMKNRFPKDWRERQEVVTNQQAQLDLSQLSNDDLLRLQDALRFVNAKVIEG